MDLRLPIGMLFTLLGALLAIYGFASDPAIYAVSLGVNVNAWWGLAMALFGVVMLALSWMGRKAQG